MDDEGPPHDRPPRSAEVSLSALPDERESELCRQADDQLRAQGLALESLIENLNEGVYLDESFMCALGKLKERVQKGALKLRSLDSQRDQHKIRWKQHSSNRWHQSNRSNQQSSADRGRCQ
jgi:hypothetical protein